MLYVYTDGSCLNNQSIQNQGGCSFIVTDQKNIIYEYSESERNTTNNRMELLACIRAMEYATREPNVLYTLYTDSNYVIQGLYGWSKIWEENHWMTSNKKTPVQNQDLWKTLLALHQKCNVSLQKIKAHAGNEYNERADQLAKDAAAKA